MKYKTLFRLMLKIIGVWIFAEGAQSSVTLMAAIGYTYSQSPFLSVSSVAWYQIVQSAGTLLYAAFGVYLFFGGKWIVDKAIPSNRPYCHECGYDLTAAAQHHCPECGTPFRPEDVMPRSAATTDQSTTAPTTDH